MSHAEERRRPNGVGYGFWQLSYASAAMQEDISGEVVPVMNAKDLFQR
ncbi:MAG: hypothetical protein ABGY96_12775 [bacterium]